MFAATVFVESSRSLSVTSPLVSEVSGCTGRLPSLLVQIRYKSRSRRGFTVHSAFTVSGLHALLPVKCWRRQPSCWVIFPNAWFPDAVAPVPPVRPSLDTRCRLARSSIRGMHFWIIGCGVSSGWLESRRCQECYLLGSLSGWVSPEAVDEV